MPSTALVLLLLLSGCTDPQQMQYNAALREFGERNVAGAFKSINTLAQNGYAAAQFRLGIFYLHGIGIAANPTQAAYWFDKAAGQNHPGGQYSLARMYLSGVGVSKNPTLAIEQLTPLAEQQFAPAQLQLGLLYDAGIGTERDVKTAQHWITQSAENGYPKAIEAMVQAYSRGVMGLDKDPQMASYWRAKARPQSF